MRGIGKGRLTDISSRKEAEKKRDEGLGERYGEGWRGETNEIGVG